MPTLYVPSGHGSHDPGDTPRLFAPKAQPALYEPGAQAAQAVQAWEPSALLYLPGAHLDRSLYHSAVLVQHLLPSVSELRRYLSYSAANLPRSWIAPGTQVYPQTRIAPGTQLDYPPRTELEVATACEPCVAHAL